MTETAQDLASDVPPDVVLFGDDVVARAQAIVARYPQSRSALLPMLHLVQSVEGHVSQRGSLPLRFICRPSMTASTRAVAPVAVSAATLT